MRKASFTQQNTAHIKRLALAFVNCHCESLNKIKVYFNNIQFTVIKLTKRNGNCTRVILIETSLSSGVKTILWKLYS